MIVVAMTTAFAAGFFTAKHYFAAAIITGLVAVVAFALDLIMWDTKTDPPRSHHGGRA